MPHPLDYEKLCFYFHSSQRIFWFYIWSLHWSNAFIVVCCLFSALVLFPFFFIYLISSFTPLFETKMVDIISILLWLLKLVFWLNMWFIIMKISCVLQKNVNSAVFGWNVLLFVKFNWSNMPFMITVPFKLSVWFVLYVSGLLKSSTVSILLPISPFMSMYIWFVYLDVPLLVHIC